MLNLTRVGLRLAHKSRLGARSDRAGERIARARESRGPSKVLLFHVQLIKGGKIN